MTPSDLQRFRLRRGDLLVCEGGEIGRAAIWDEPIPECYYQKALHRLRPKRGYSPYLMMCFLGLWSLQDGLANYVTQTSIAHLPKDKFELVPLPVPPPAEQRVIAAALSDVDGLIEALDAAVAKKRAIKLAAMQQLLTGKTRLPGFEKRHGDRITDVGRIPMDWRVSRLRECLRRAPSCGINAPSVPYDDTSPTYVRITDIDEDGRFNPSPKVSVRHPNSVHYLLDEGDLVFARTGASVGKSYRYKLLDGPLVFAGFLIRVTPDTQVLDPVFLSHYVQSKTYWDWVTMMSARSGQPGINGQEYGQLLLPLPDLAEQRSIAEAISDMDAEITGLEQRREKTKAIKQGMMQALLTGRVRLVES